MREQLCSSSSPWRVPLRASVSREGLDCLSFACARTRSSAARLEQPTRSRVRMRLVDARDRCPRQRDRPVRARGENGYDGSWPLLHSVSVPRVGRTGEPPLFAVSPRRHVVACGSRHAWSFGDGRRATGQRVTHEFRRPGRYTVTILEPRFRRDCLSGPGWNRTNDLGIKSPLLCQLSYRPAEPPV